MEETVTDETLAGDLLQGMAAISHYVGIPERRGYYLPERKLIPAFKIGEVWCLRKSTMNRRIETLESGGES